MTEFRGPGLSESQWHQIRTLATTLDNRQLQWLSGFFAGIEFKAGDWGTHTPLAPTQQDAVSSRRITILYGSETGNSSALAASLAERARAEGFSPQLFDMADYKLRGLKEEQDLLLIASTYGEGDPPQPAANFFEFVESRKAPRLPGLRFAVLALGDSTYERYCEAGKRLDRRFEELGAIRLQPRVDCDVDYDEPAAAWMANVLGHMAKPASTIAASPAAAEPRTSTGFDKRNPFAARILDNLVLSGRGSSKQTLHVEISLEGSGLAYEPGDCLGLMPSNDPAVVDAMIGELGFDGAATVTVKDTPFAIQEALARHVEITALTPRFIEHWAGITGAEALRRLGDPASVEDRSAFMRGHHILDVVRRFPAKGLDPQMLIAGLRPLQPRLYSIASSLSAAPDEAHLTVSTVRYELAGEPRSGVASGHLADRGQPDQQLPIYVHANPHFRLPADDVPIIMVGAGTGVAPYRAFMQEREARATSGRSWLVFGERNFRTDFLYQSEWLAMLSAGVLTRMDVAFSRDGRREGRDRIYVQHRLKEQARDVFAWLEDGACFYVCGDASRMAPDVHQALRSIIATQGGLGADAADDYLQRLQREHRYQRDVY
ncbi:assimilatory sulfite reductase (NADPH) flavoprotein subunit [Labrys sp. KNU-23]|nr:assimilatory sulfite reductase (NADPH) flavoprotein subunit [Labrys sp. KNU-23]QEN86477.1 assimilatory sulfite reductase (NADPH) flavoprotein subunit [Labrys sp. KNU-23]